LIARKQPINVSAWQNYWKYPIFETIIKEYIGKTSRKYRADAKVTKRPNGVFPRRSAAEILSGHEDSSIAVTVVVQYKIVIQWPPSAVLPRFALIQIAPSIEEVVTKTRFLNRFKELLRNDRISIDVASV
jgi:hypothetical protein